MADNYSHNGNGNDPANPGSKGSLQENHSQNDERRGPAVTRYPAQPERKKSRLKLGIGLVCGAVLALSVLAVCCIRTDRAPQEPAVGLTLSKGPDYSILIQNWNQYAREFPAAYQLIGERAASPQAVVNTLKKWCAPFAEPADAAVNAELSSLAEEQGTTTFHKWEEFRNRHRQNLPIDINADMQSSLLATAVNSYLHISSHGKTPDYISRETVMTIVEMNSLCEYFMQEKSALHREGIDTQIHSCKGLATSGKYRLLDEQLK